MEEKHQKTHLIFWQLHLNWLPQIVTITKGTLRQSICQQTVLRFQISLRETFSNSIFLGVMEKNVLSCRFQQCLGHLSMLTVEGCSETGLFTAFSNHAFCSL